MYDLHRMLPVTLLACGVMAPGCVLSAHAAFGDRITVSGVEFRAGTNRIWINGANTPWHAWNDFGGEFNRAWWDRHFRQLHENGINATRVWISCSGEGSVKVDPDGRVTGCTPAFWKDLDSLLQIARERQVYLMATLLSFDHFSTNHNGYLRWRKMIASDENIDSLVDHYVLPLVNRYQDNPWLWSIDLLNEPDWVHENVRSGRITWDRIQTYVAKASAAIHAHSRILVTVGICMGPKYTSTALGINVVSDRALRARAGEDPRARLDFYSPHHYDWMSAAYENAFYLSPTDYGLDDTRPSVIGECPAKGTRGHTIAEDYEKAYENGWQGAMGWTSNGVDANGSLNQLGPATRAFRDRHYNLVFPGVSDPQP